MTQEFAIRKTFSDGFVNFRRLGRNEDPADAKASFDESVRFEHSVKNDRCDHVVIVKLEFLAREVPDWTVQETVEITPDA